MLRGRSLDQTGELGSSEVGGKLGTVGLVTDPSGCSTIWRKMLVLFFSSFLELISAISLSLSLSLFLSLNL